jgi:hypothetical protein
VRASERIDGALRALRGVPGHLALAEQAQRPVGRATLLRWAQQLRRAADLLDAGLEKKQPPAANERRDDIFGSR